MLHAHGTGAQTIDGRLLDAQTRLPISLGLVTMLSASGEPVASAITSQEGTFSVSSGEPGDFLLVASALGYGVTPDGVFELGRGGRLSIEFRVAPVPIQVDDLIVSLSRRAHQHPLVLNGFVGRHERGLGRFLTPVDIERSTAESTEMLLEGIDGVHVRTVNTIFDLSERVQLTSSSGEWCDPGIFVDGSRIPYDFDRGDRLSQIVPLPTVDAVEIYRRPAEIPFEYGISGVKRSRGAPAGVCGILLFWTKSR